MILYFNAKKYISINNIYSIAFVFIKCNVLFPTMTEFVSCPCNFDSLSMVLQIHDHYILLWNILFIIK